MKRTIVQPADVSGSPLADLKSWLGISRSSEDALLIELINASLALCETFIDHNLLEQTIEERFATDASVMNLSSSPVRALVSAELVGQDGTRIALSDGGFTFVLDAHGCAKLDITTALEGQYVAVQVVAGIAADWTGLPSALKQGVIRLAAYHYRDRDQDSDAGRSAPPPASVAALWRPWRSIRLS